MIRYDGYTAEILQIGTGSRPGLSDFWRSWDNCTGLKCDQNLFEDVKEKISFGLLYLPAYLFIIMLQFYPMIRLVYPSRMHAFI